MEVATDMPGEVSDRQLDEGIRLARGGLVDKALQQLERAAGSGEPSIVAQAFRHKADLHRSRCEWSAALDCARRSARLARRADQPDLLADALNAEASVHISRGDFSEARPLLERMMAVSDDARIHGIARQNLGIIAAEERRLDDAEAHFDGALTAFQAIGYERGAAVALLNSGRVSLLRDECDGAEDFCLRAESTARSVGDLELVALSCLNLAECYLRRGRPTEAERPASEAMGYFSGVGNQWRRVECLRVFGDIHEATGDSVSADRCYRRGLELALEIGADGEVQTLERKLRLLGSA